MSQCSEHELVESRNYIRHKFDEILNRPLHGLPRHRRILPRYMDGSLSLKFCLCLGHSQLWVDIRRKVNTETSSAKFSLGDKRQSVLVDVYENSEESESRISTLIGLDLLELSNYRIGDFVIRSRIVQPTNIFLESAGLIPQREVRFVLPLGRSYQNSPRISASNLPHNVVESAGEIMKAISDDGTQPVVGVADTCSSVPLRIASLLQADDVRIIVKVPENFIGKGIKMFLCPDDFESCSV